LDVLKIFQITFHRIFTSSFNICNSGHSPPDTDVLVEIQPLASNEKFFTVLFTNQGTCNPRHPDNVHTVIPKGNLLPGDCVSVELKTPPLAGDTYTIKGVSVDRCCPSGSCIDVDPFHWGTNLGQIAVPVSIETICGDKLCSSDENAESCNTDCGPFLGDGVCSAGEKWPDESACPKPILQQAEDKINTIGPGAIMIVITLIAVGIIVWALRK